VLGYTLSQTAWLEHCLGLYLTANSLAGPMYWAISYCKQFGWNTVLGYTLSQTAWLEHCIRLYLTANSLARTLYWAISNCKQFGWTNVTANSLTGTLYWAILYRKQLGWNTVLGYIKLQTAWLEHYFVLALLQKLSC
jgi:hypothetical protein